MTKLELIIKVKRLEADCKAYNFTQHELQEKNKELENELQWERDTKSELADYLGKANDRVADLEDKLANADCQIEGRDLKIKDLEETVDKLREQFALRYDLEDKIKNLEAQNKELQCCANCRFSYGGEEEPYHDCGYCHAMQCICKLKLEEHTSDIYREWENKCERWEMRVN